MSKYAEGVLLFPDMNGKEHHNLTIRASDTDGYGNKLLSPQICISLSIDGGPKVIVSRNELVGLVDDVLIAQGEVNG